MTIKDLSAETGYSVGTISRVLNQHPNVSERARRTILDAVERSGFELNENARNLKQVKSNTLLVVVKGTSNELFSALVEQLQIFLADTRYPLIIDYIDEDANEVRRAVHLCREKKPLGILFLGGNIMNFKEFFHQITVPCVLVTNSAASLSFPNLSSVTTDDMGAASQAISHLISQGHRRIAVIGGCPDASDISRTRYQGCLQAFADAGLQFDPEKDYRSVRFSYQDGYNAAVSLTQKDPGITAIFAMADVMAIGAMRALWDLGYQIPQDISVIGYDGLPIGSYMLPKLTTIAQQASELARQSAALLLECLEHEDTPPQHLTVPYRLECRESVKPLNTTPKEHT